jgi:hypothetical protein
MTDGLIALDPGARRAILEAAASLQAETETLLARMVRHRSVLGQGSGGSSRLLAAADRL